MNPEELKDLEIKQLQEKLEEVNCSLVSANAIIKAGATSIKRYRNTLKLIVAGLQCRGEDDVLCKSAINLAEEALNKKK